MTHRLLSCLVTFIFLASCAPSDEEKINLLIDKRMKAFELKDPTIYSECIYEDYKVISEEEITDKEKLVNRFSDQVSAVDAISFGEPKRYIYINRQNARILLLSSIKLEIDDNSITHKSKEVINVSKVLGEWKITRESELNLLSETMILEN